MIPDGDYTAVVDRIEAALATLEISGDNERYSLVVDEETLPEAARHTDAVLQITLVNEELTAVAYDPDETERRAKTAQDRFDRLAERPPNGDDDADSS
jgi:hypothetical protein